MKTVTVESPANIAFTKYWGNRDDSLRLPMYGSLSMNLAGATTTTSVNFSPDFSEDTFWLASLEVSGEEKKRVVKFLDVVREIAGKKIFARVESVNSFPKGAGIASSASAFSALALAATRALDMELTEQELSALARRGSGSACRSIPDGFVEWMRGKGDDSYAISLYPPEYWDIVDSIAIVDAGQKKVGSTEGHQIASTSRLFSSRVQTQGTIINSVKQAISTKDFTQFGELIEEETLNMHAVMMTSQPSLLYWSPGTIEIMHALRQWRAEGITEAYFTIDAGANVHVISQGKNVKKVSQLLRQITAVNDVLVCKPAPGARVISVE